MDREKGIWHRVLSTMLTILPLAAGCMESQEETTCSENVTIELSAETMTVRSAMPDEEKISDVNILIFNSRGHLERHIYSIGNNVSYQTGLLKGEEYTFTALANFGMKVNINGIESLDDIFFHLVYPDEYKEGLPMYVKPVRHTIGSEDRITLNLTRLMSKISISIDRSALSEDVSMTVTGLRIGNCPKRMSVFKPNSSKSSDDNFQVGFSHGEQDCAILNGKFNNSTSGSIDVYMLENMQGAFSENGITADQDKVFKDSDSRTQTCSYIELFFDYASPTWISNDGPLKYRFYLGADRNNLDIERNCHYKITVCPKDDGIGEDGWRVDKSNLHYVGTTLMEQYPSDYIRGNIGEKIHIGCRITPPHAPFDIGLDYLEYDKERGIYEYEIDPDGHGVTLTLTGAGTGLIYMEAGYPINDTALFLIEVNLP